MKSGKTPTAKTPGVSAAGKAGGKQAGKRAGNGAGASVAPERPRRASSLKHAAGLLGVSAGILREAKAAGCPGFDDHNRVDLEAVEGWLKLQRGSVVEVLTKEGAEIKRILLMCDRIEFRNRVERNEFTSNEVIFEKLTRLGADQLRILRQKLESELPARVFGLPHVEIKAVGKGLVEELAAMMRGLVEEWRQLTCGPKVNGPAPP